jgi:hypothetical protein
MTMNRHVLAKMCIGAGAAWVVCAALISQAEPPEGGTPAAAPPAKQQVPLAVARERAKLAGDIYESTLHVMHRYYFHGDRATVPARALEDVFADLDDQANIESRWISVNTKPMSIDHEPKTDVEKQAAAAIVAGKGPFELVEKGYYHTARPIPLTSGCIGCHNGFFAEAARTKRFAGLVISIPIKEE